MTLDLVKDSSIWHHKHEGGGRKDSLNALKLECREAGTVTPWRGYTMVKQLWKTAWRPPKQLHVVLPYDPAIPPLGTMYTQSRWKDVHVNTWTQTFTAALFTIARRLERTQVATSARLGDQNVVCPDAAASLQSCPTLCDRPHRRQPTRLPCPWDSPGKSTGVGCHFLLQCMKVISESEVALLCPTLHDPMDCSPPGSAAHGIFQTRVLEWGAMKSWGLPGGPVVRNPSSKAGNLGLIPGWGAKIPHGQLSPHTATREARASEAAESMHSRPREPQQGNVGLSAAKSSKERSEVLIHAATLDEPWKRTWKMSQKPTYCMIHSYEGPDREINRREK